MELSAYRCAGFDLARPSSPCFFFSFGLFLLFLSDSGPRPAAHIERRTCMSPSALWPAVSWHGWWGAEPALLNPRRSRDGRELQTHRRQTPVDTSSTSPRAGLQSSSQHQPCAVPRCPDAQLPDITAAVLPASNSFPGLGVLPPHPTPFLVSKSRSEHQPLIY
jgi:hypothetical protein